MDVEGGSAVIVPVQKAPPFVEQSLLIYRISWTSNVPRPLQGEGVDVRLHERGRLRQALRHERIQGQLECRHKYQRPHRVRVRPSRPGVDHR
jgi:hypothetical protein